MAEERVSALSFGNAAQRYDRCRPDYPPAAATWALGEASSRVLDLGAGTGKLSRILLGLGHQVTAVEPDAQMRDQLGPELRGRATFPMPHITQVYRAVRL